jgi:hypothetical protein|tara:strand:+ start:2722 stop:3972 length:1251 start_codon:yes stop_codon:yes gene_type:complete
MASLPLATLQQVEAQANAGSSKKSVILFWLSGGPSQIDMWDPKPDAPVEIRSPFGTISTVVPGVQFTECLPRQAAIADKLAVLRGVDCSASNHTPITMQAGNPLARRTNDGKDGGGYPSMGSVVAKFRGANDPSMPAFVGLAKTWTSDVYGAGHMGSKFEPVKGLELADKFKLPDGLNIERLQNRAALREQINQARRRLENNEVLDRFDANTQRAYEMVLSGKVERAFDISQETDELRESYGRVSVGEKAILARRLVEAGVSFVLVSGAWGYFDHHGDSVRWGGIEKGLKPLLPRVDQVYAALIEDLEQRGMLDDTLVMMMGEFGRSPKINTDAGRDHWVPVMSMIMSGGGIQGGQVIGSTDRTGGEIKSGKVRPQDLAATTFKHLGINLDSHWTDPQGRPIPIVQEGGQPVSGLI